MEKEAASEVLCHLLGEGPVVVLLHPLPEALGVEKVVRQGHAGQQVHWEPAAAVPLRRCRDPGSRVG